MLSDKQKRYVQLTIILVGSILGSMFLPTLLNNNTKASGLLGGFIGLFVSIAIFPETVKSIFEKQSELRQKRVKEEMIMGLWRSWTHPTQLPITIGMLWFVGIALLDAVFRTIFDDIQDKSWVVLMFLLPPLFLFGLGGLLMVLRKEGVDRHGRKYFGSWVYINGSLQMIFCWGLLIVLSLSTIFKW